MGTKNAPGNFDCYAKALPDEPMFTLLARDLDAPELVYQWACRRLARDGMTFKVREAFACAESMRKWQQARLIPLGP